MESEVDHLCSQSEEVMRVLQAAAKHGDDASVEQLRASVAAMVTSYADAWPRLAPCWSSLQAEQGALAHTLHVHALTMQQEVAAAAYMLHHPQHGAATKLDTLLAAEQQLDSQLQHAQRASDALAIVQSIRASMHALQSGLPAAPSLSPDGSSPSAPASLEVDADAWSTSFGSMEAQLQQLASLEAPAMAQTQFFLQLQHDVQQLRQRMVQLLLNALAQAVHIDLERAGLDGQSASDADLVDTLPASTSVLLRVTVNPSLPLLVLFAAMHRLRASDRCVRMLGTSLLRVLEPLLHFVSSNAGLDQPLYFATSKHKNGRSLRIRVQEDIAELYEDATPTMEGSALEVVLMLFDFIWQQVFSAAASDESAGVESTDRPASMHELGLFVCPRLQPLLLRHLCHASVPRNVDNLLSFPSRMSQKLREFEQQALQRGLLRMEPDASAGPITLFLSSLTSAFQQRVRERVLQHTKQLVINNTFDTQRFGARSDEEQHREDKAFPSIFYSHAHSFSQSPNSPAASAHSLMLHHTQQIFARSTAFGVSRATYALVRMLYELYTEAFRAQERVSEECCASMFSCIRDSVHLFLAISPVYRGSELESILHMSFLFHNDCAFIAKHLTALHAHMKVEDMRRHALAAAEPAAASSSAAVPAASTSPSTSSSRMLVDLATPLTALGSKYFLQQLARQRGVITDLTETLSRLLGDLDDDSAWHAALQAVKQTLHQLASVEKAWHQLMGGNLALRGAAAQAGGIASAPAHSNGWPLTLGLLLEQLTSRLVGMVLEKSDISVEGASRIYQLFSLISTQYASLDPRHTPSWSCFLTVRNILHPDQNLAHLSSDFTNGQLNSLTPQELSHLIRALYEESAHRTRFLQLLSAATGGAAGIAEMGMKEKLRTLADTGSGHAASAGVRALSLANSALSSIRAHGTTQRIQQALHDTKHRLQQR